MKPEYIQKILASTKLDKTEIKKLVGKKRAELMGLISEEGALYIVAKELGVSLNGEKGKSSNNQIPKDTPESISQVSEGKERMALLGHLYSTIRQERLKLSYGTSRQEFMRTNDL